MNSTGTKQNKFKLFYLRKSFEFLTGKVVEAVILCVVLARADYFSV